MPAPVIARLNTITYGGFVVGGTSDYQLHDVHSTEVDYFTTRVTFGVVVADVDTVSMVALASALEAAYRKPDQDFLLVIGGTTIKSFTQAGNDGFNAQPQATLTDTHRTNRTRAYSCSITFNHPADLAGKAGRRTSSVAITTSAEGLLSVDVQARYTALGGLSASANVAASFPAFVASVLTAAGGVYDPATPMRVDQDDNDKFATVTASYQEIFFPQTQTLLDDPDIVNASFRARVLKPTNQSDTRAIADELATITIDFACGVVRTAEPSDVYETKVIGYLTQLAQDLAGGPFLAKQSEDVSYGLDRNSISATVSFLSASVDLIRSNLTVTDLEDTHETTVEVADGDPFSADLHKAKGRRNRVLQLVTLEIDKNTPGRNPLVGLRKDALKLLTEAQKVFEGQGFRTQSTSQVVKRTTIEVDGIGIPVVERFAEATLKYVRVRAIATNRASGGGRLTTSARSGLEDGAPRFRDA